MSNFAHTHREDNQVVAAESRFSSFQERAEHNTKIALRAARSGLPVYPVNPTPYKPHKGAPLSRHGRSEATTDEAQIREWWALWPDAMPGMATGTESGLIVLDIDPPGLQHFEALLHELGCETAADLSPCRTLTPRTGLHLCFEYEPGTTPATRAGDIAPGIDTRGLGGSIVLPGSIRRDGRRYQWQGGCRTFHDAPRMPRHLLFLATFNARDRQLIAETPELADLHKAPATDWIKLLQRWRSEQAAKLAERAGMSADDNPDRMRRYALSALRNEAQSLAERTDGRRTGLFMRACAVAKYVVHAVLSDDEFKAAFVAAANANGSIARYGQRWALTELDRAKQTARNDQLPQLLTDRTGGR